MRDTFETPQHLFDRNIMGVQFSDVTGQWNVKGKNADYGNALVNMTYGTSRRNAYQILEDSLNLKDSRVYDTIEEDGKEKRVLNKKETTLAAQKQDTIREAFKDWVFRDPDRRQDLVAKYNKLFNSTSPSEYDGSHLKFPGMTPDIELKPHQKSAVAHVLYGDNTLLAHCVGAGKTFEMTAAAMESKRLGLCQKSLFVVPNHLTEQWASDFLRLYPGANILAATKKDFEPANRKKFCSRIATGDYDAVIIGHSQFEKIPLSQERQAAMIERQIDEIETAIAMAKADNGERYTIKQMEKSRKALQTSHNLEIGSDPLGNIARINHALESMPKQLAEAQTKLENVEHQLETAKAEVQKPFSQEQELAEKLDRLSALNALLNMDEKGNDGIGMEDEPETSEGDREVADRSAKNIPLAEKLTDTGQNKGGRQYTDVPAARVSLKEKLEAFKVKAAEGDADKATPKKAKDKAEIL